MPDLKSKALQLNIEGLLKLLGGSSSERLRYWEKKKGITTPIEFFILNQHLDSMANLVKQVEVGAKTLNEAAERIGNRKG